MTRNTVNPSATAQKDESQERQKRMIGEHFTKLANTHETGRKCAYTFVPGNLTELLHAFDVLPVLPEINALQSGMRGKAVPHEWEVVSCVDHCQLFQPLELSGIPD